MADRFHSEHGPGGELYALNLPGGRRKTTAPRRSDKPPEMGEQTRRRGENERGREGRERWEVKVRQRERERERRVEDREGGRDGKPERVREGGR